MRVRSSTRLRVHIVDLKLRAVDLLQVARMTARLVDPHRLYHGVGLACASLIIATFRYASRDRCRHHIDSADHLESIVVVIVAGVVVVIVVIIITIIVVVVVADIVVIAGSLKEVYALNVRYVCSVLLAVEHIARAIYLQSHTWLSLELLTLN